MLHAASRPSSLHQQPTAQILAQFFPLSNKSLSQPTSPSTLNEFASLNQFSPCQIAPQIFWLPQARKPQRGEPAPAQGNALGKTAPLIISHALPSAPGCPVSGLGQRPTKPPTLKELDQIAPVAANVSFILVSRIGILQPGVPARLC